MMSCALAVNSNGTAMSALAAVEFLQTTNVEAGRENNTASDKDMTQHKHKVKEDEIENRQIKGESEPKIEPRAMAQVLFAG